MATTPDLSLILPAYQEAAVIGRELDAILSYLKGGPYSFELIVSADGDDGTRERALERASRDARILVVGGPERRGKGRAVREAVALSRGRLVGYLDADGKTPIAELEKVVPLLEGDWDVVIGSRALCSSQLQARRPFHRRVGSWAFGALVHRVVGLADIHDTQCGFKFFRGEVARALFARQQVDGYAFDVELLWMARRLGYRIREVPIRWHDDRDSRLQLGSGSLGILRDLWRIRTASRSAEARPPAA